MDIDRTLAAVAEALNHRKLETFEAARLHEVAKAHDLTVDDGGGLHDRSGTRVGCIRKTPSGEWIVERQNTGAHNSDTAIPAPAPGGEQQ